MSHYDATLGREVELIDEMYVVPNLVKHSTEFKQFYNEERMQKLGDIIWLLDTAAPSEYTMSSKTAILNGVKYPIIYIKESPVPIEDACIAAHEIMHCIFTEEGKSLDIQTSDLSYAILGSLLKTMLEDPIINSILQHEYNFDILTSYKKVLGSSKEKLFREPQEEPKDDVGMVCAALSISIQVLDWSIITDRDAIEEWNAFIKQYENLYPTIFKMSRNIVSIVSETGIETIEESRSTFQKIIEKYDLKDCLFIGSPGL